MAVQLWPNRRKEETPAAEETRRRRFWPPRRSAPEPEERRGPRRWPRSRTNPISGMIWGAGCAAALILGLGMLLTWSDANPGNGFVSATLDAGTWLATPFRDVFTNPDPERQMYMNWGLGAVVYYLLGRLFSTLTRF
ncbi:hypothetical protein DPM19_07560 [Actinomadura craniellae]|uniref:Uncharacterized protein n=1 Tax=Actinomadura craniellae TaxID=2231787 RepID=A0A365H9D5_9ACTN|nr:hypothetical protein [Actinomadura craniellae]RAY15639.1 hypothetical protein DPM19_07560 [Actinomadura craniellae]